MATPISFNGASYNVPAYGDSGWAQGAGNLSSYLIAIAAGTLQTTGGNFTLSANANFGATYGLLAKYFTTVAASPATAGVIRLAIGDTIDWGPANNALSVTGTTLQWNGLDVVTSSVGVTPTEVREDYIAGTALNNYTGSLTLVNLVSTYKTNGVNLNVFVNGLCNDRSFDYSETSTSSFTFNSPLNTGDRISCRWTKY